MWSYEFPSFFRFIYLFIFCEDELLFALYFLIRSLITPFLQQWKIIIVEQEQFNLCEYL